MIFLLPRGVKKTTTKIKYICTYMTFGSQVIHACWEGFNSSIIKERYDKRLRSLNDKGSDCLASSE